jgi:putative endonuclease
MKRRRETGALGEKLAAELLTDKGYQIVETNARFREGEIDIVARDGDCLVFVEVRTKTSRRFGTPEESITARKRQHLRATAARYLSEHEGLPEMWRIDIVAVEIAGNRLARIDHIESAVGEE